jgi:hypothetical protein
VNNSSAGFSGQVSPTRSFSSCSPKQVNEIENRYDASEKGKKHQEAYSCRKINLPGPGTRIRTLYLTGNCLKAPQYNIRHRAPRRRRRLASKGRNHVRQLQEPEFSATLCKVLAEIEILDHDSTEIVGGQLGIRCQETMELEAS